MGRLLIFFVAAFILDVFALIDLILIDRRRVRAFPKIVWGIIIVLVPFIGALLWFFVGHEWGTRGGERRTIAPDDDPSFLKNLRRDEDQDERIRRLEQELADLDDDPPTT
ncbi:MAG TPA: PLD nuclease N-terminal domain-containing protein [Rhodoglobus sp.]|nr:PLD nuclease N-terminal domain-containing protein [Rhodoglobus sp.]HOT34078.1 PLD nuclease N-terminal domain-containing protein [Rhodoglobus sp.]HQI66870.1 PLD nuclease N-terminal domain-containing protein [Rhodoglobus sp.]HQJ35874.1 PLD nuclease N-terminal domain-containing protein [Rhodoglobus sp.]